MIPSLYDATVQPYISFVGWTRNDGYTPDYIDRTRHAVGYLARQLGRHRLLSELLIVEWNPPADRSLMADVLGGLPVPEHVVIRMIIVDGKFHRRYRGWRQRGIHTVECVNVGLRRARGLFSTPKALDTYFSDALVARLARRDLDPDCVYRCDRYDVRMERQDWLDYSDEKVQEAFKTAPAQRNARLHQSPLWKIGDLHTNACGDFTLLADKRWRQMHGYPKDRTVMGMDADSIALHAAAAHGAREVCWPDDCRIYKINHGNFNAKRSSAVWRPWQERLERYLLRRGKDDLAHEFRMWLDYPKRHVHGMLGPSIERNFVAKATRFAKGDVSRPINDANWGFGNVSLPERIVSIASRDDD